MRHLGPEKFSSRRTLSCLLAVAGLFVMLDLLNRATIDGRFLRMDEEQNLFTWVSSMTFAAAAAASAILAAGRRETGRAWRLLALLLLALSIDEVAMMHERLESAADARLSFLLLQPIVAVGAVVLLVAVMRGVGLRERPMIAAAIGALVLAQAGSILASELELEGAIAAAQGIIEEVLELSVPGLVLAAALPVVGPVITSVVRTTDESPQGATSGPRPPRAG